MPETSMSGARVAWASQGRGEPALLLLPGWCETRAVFEPLALRLARTRQVVTLDWRGHGASVRRQAHWPVSRSRWIHWCRTPCR